MDSLAQVNNWGLKFNDPTYRAVNSFINKYLENENQQCTLFVIGRDLETKSNVEFIKSWNDLGMEIGNHTYSHRFDFFNLTLAERIDELSRTNKLIKKAIGFEPKGFVAPLWNNGPNLTSVLVNMNFSYHCSEINAFWRLPMNWLIWNQFRKFQNKNSLRPIFYSNNTFSYRRFTLQKTSGLKTFEIPSLKYIGIPVYHTTILYLGRRIGLKLLEQSIKKGLLTNYVIHPFDIMETNINKPEFSRVPRKNFSITEKVSCYYEVLKILNQYNIKFTSYKNVL